MTFRFAILSSLFFAGGAGAADFDQETNPQVLQVEYRANHTVQVPFQAGVSKLSVAVDCQTSPEAAIAAVKSRLAATEESVKTSIQNLGLAEQESLGYQIEAPTEAQLSNPVANTLDAQKKQYLWTNRCTGEKSDKPFVADFVYGASAMITVSYPNEGTLLNKLTELVSALEKSTSESKINEAKVFCLSAQGTNYDLSVTPAVEKKAWEEVKKVAQVRAAAKQSEDSQIFNYTNIWAMPDEFTTNSSRFDTGRHPVNVVEENGEWVAKINDVVPFTVYVKQAANVPNNADTLSLKKNYDISAEVSSTKGIYASLTINLVQACFTSKQTAETALTAAAQELIKKLREINGGQKPGETDRLEIHDVASQIYSPLLPYQQLVDEGSKSVDYFYNLCTLETYAVVDQPKDITAWSASQHFKIVSKDIKALKKLKDELDSKYRVTSSKADLLRADTSWQSSVTLEVQDELDTKFHSVAALKFLAPDSPFVCEKNKFTFACLSKESASERVYDRRRDAGFGAAPKAPGGYNESVAEVDATERGLKEFTGTYTIRSIVRKVFE